METGTIISLVGTISAIATIIISGVLQSRKQGESTGEVKQAIKEVRDDTNRLIAIVNTQRADISCLQRETAKFSGITETKFAYLEEKMDKHNGLYDKVVMTEQSTKSAHHRLDRLEGMKG